VQLAGGAAGDDLAMKKTHVGCNQYVATNAVVVAMIYSKQRLGVGVGHGHTPISRSVKVTKATGNVVNELDGRPAWTVWKELSRDAAMKSGLNPDHLKEADEGAYLLRYEAGLPIEGGVKVRAPLSRSADGSISFAAGIPHGADLQVTSTSAEEQIQSAGVAARDAMSKMNGGEVAGAVVFDCICRNLILGGQFGNAVRSISHSLGDVPIAGFETYGEIALSAGDMSGFHNTTTVVLTFPKSSA
jgi:methyl-accepting chemotaxis protein